MSSSSGRSIHELADLGGRRALVAGGAGHVGRAAVDALREAGAEVAVCDLEEGPPGVPSVVCDLADEAAVRGAVASAADALGGLDILVHCAALVGTSDLEGWAVPFELQTVDAWEAALRVNLTSAFVLVQEARPLLAAHGRGSVILFGSIYGIVGPNPALYAQTAMANPTAYGVSKGGLLQLVRYLATQLAPEVRVNAISPGGIERGQPAVFRERYEAATPLRRLATEEDVKGAVAFLAGDLSAYVTGQNLLVDGGWTAW
jgi:NAD(P)-dependent dehydrogenase (short-subunit alcohol dehydrogenase family)